MRHYSIKILCMSILLAASYIGGVLGQHSTGISIRNLYTCMTQVPSYFWHTTTDDLGNTYMGLYTQGDGTELCAYIFKKDNLGKISIVYYDRARHIHTVAFNPITKKLYASQGDDIPRISATQGQSKFVVSADYGKTRTTLQHYPRSNYIPILFDTAGCVIVGEDSAQYSPSSRLMRTCNDKSFTTLITLSGDLAANWWSWYQTGSTLYVGTVVDRAGFSPSVWRSDDDGRSWYLFVSAGTGSQARDGYHSMRTDQQGLLHFTLGNARKETSAFTSLLSSGNTN